MISNTLVYFLNKSTFEKELEAGEILDKSIVFIKETGEIWTHGRYYTDYEKIKKVLFESGPGSLSDTIKNLRKSILGDVSEDYNTLSKIESFLKNPQGYTPGPGIIILEGTISVNVDDESIEITEDGKLKIKTIDGGTY